MPPLTIQQLKTILDSDTTPYRAFIETGTNYGDTIEEIRDFFEEVHTIEINREFYEAAKARIPAKNVVFHLGDSIHVLPRILPSIRGPVIFWLDGHKMGKDVKGGEKDVPILEELAAIMKHVNERALILIDDCRLFGTNNPEGEDWTDISMKAIRDIVHSRTEKCHRFSSYLDERDRLAIWLTARSDLPLA